MRGRFLVSLALVVLLAALAGCAGAETPTPTPTPAPTATPTASPTPPPTVTAGPGPLLPQFADVVARVRPAVVSVLAEVVTRSFFGDIVEHQSGTGVALNAQGYILTNNHVIEDARWVSVTLDDGRELDAEVVGADTLTDLAVLKVEVEGGLPGLPIGDSEALRVGDWVIAIGNALALPGGPTVTVGVVSALGRSIADETGNYLYDLIQTDATINPGNSGGPLLNLNGEVVGINTAILRGSEVEGIGFAIPSETFVPVAAQLMESGRVRWPYMGVFLDDLGPTEAARLGLPAYSGALVAFVERGSPAYEAGLQRDDVILSMDGVPVEDAQSLIKLLRFSYNVGDEVELRLYREGEELTLTVRLEERGAGG